MENKSAQYKYCIVPGCHSTTFNTSNKHFFTLPAEPKRRVKWLKACRRDKKDISLRSKGLYVCEDHFNLEQDMDNYIKFKIMGCPKKIKSGVVPHIFDCQVDRKRSFSQAQRKTTLKRVKRQIVEDAVASTSKSVLEDFDDNRQCDPSFTNLAESTPELDDTTSAQKKNESRQTHIKVRSKEYNPSGVDSNVTLTNRTEDKFSDIETVFADESDSNEHAIQLETVIKCEDTLFDIDTSIFNTDIEEKSTIAQEPNITRSFVTVFNDESKRNEHAIKLENDIQCEGFETVFIVESKSNEQAFKLETDIKCENTLFDINPSIYNADVIENESINAQDNSKNVFVVYYKCELCDLCFTRNKYLEAHIKSKHDFSPLMQIAVSTKLSQANPNTATFKCPMCNDSIEDINKLEKHIKTHLRFKCDRCPKNFSTLHEKQEHKKTHMFICNKCNMHFKNLDYLELHKYLHQNSYYGPFKCRKCDKRFVNKHNRNLHQKSHDLTAAETLFTCDICLESFGTIAEFHAHGIDQHTKKYKCNICNKSFETRQSENEHKRLYHKTLRVDRIEKCPSEPITLQCNICNKSFETRQSEKEHKRLYHKTLKAYRDEKCPSELITLQCKFCNRSVPNEDALRSHIFQHTGKKPIKCNKCKITFIRITKFKEHYQKVHNIDLPDFRCDRCPINFQSRQALYHHKKSHNRPIAKEIAWYQCEICTVCMKSFAAEHLLNLHMAKQHSKLVK